MKKYFLMIFVIILVSCEEFERGAPIDADDVAPDPVSNVEIKNTPGGAVISYMLPENENLLYVMAEYTLSSGKAVEKKSSYFNNSITLEGFADTIDYNVNLYSISRGGLKSKPVPVTIKPLTPPIIETFNSITMNATFGGVKISFKNESEADLRFNVLTTDSLGDLYSEQMYYTKRKEGDFSVRGFSAEERTFGIFTVDRWDNYSDTLFMTLTPFFEEELDKANFSHVPLPNDSYEQHVSGPGIPALWDGVWNVTNPVFHTKPNTGIPQSFTFDLGVEARLNRFRFHHRYSTGVDGQYNAGDPKTMEIYGSNNPASDGSWDSWQYLGTFESIKPSGEASFTNEDIQYACVDGEDFEFDIDPEDSYRYIRVNVTENWGGVSYIYIAELTFWGEVISE
jgi:hypothetical protein